MNDVITLDLSEVADEWQEAIDVLESPRGEIAGMTGIVHEDELDEARELDAKCKQLCVDLGGSPVEPATLRWLADRQGVTLIRADRFTSYAQEFAEDVFGDGARELATYVNWEAFASAMRQDYYELTYDGHEWLRRA